MDQNNFQQAAPGAPLAICGRKKNDKKPVVFYEDRMTFKGETILYSNIDTISLYAMTTTTNLIFDSYSAYVRLKLKDKRKLKWKVSAFSIFGLGSVKTKKQYFASMFQACLATIVRTIAAGYISTIKMGGTVTIGGITITPTDVTGKAFMKGAKTTPFTEIARADIDRGNVYIYGPDNKAVASGVGTATENAACLLYIVNTLAAAGTTEPVQQ